MWIIIDRSSGRFLQKATPGMQDYSPNIYDAKTFPTKIDAFTFAAEAIRFPLPNHKLSISLMCLNPDNMVAKRFVFIEHEIAYMLLQNHIDLVCEQWRQRPEQWPKFFGT